MIFFLRQLDLSHKRNELVDNQRFTILQIFFGFQAIILGATVLSGSPSQTVGQQLGAFAVFFPILVLAIDFSLFVVYFRQHIYMRGYKAWTRNLENAIRNMIFEDERSGQDDNYTGTLYFDVNKPMLIPEGTLLFTLTTMALLSLGTVFLLLQAVGASSVVSTIILSVGIASHLGAAIILWKLHGTEQA